MTVLLGKEWKPRKPVPTYFSVSLRLNWRIKEPGWLLACTEVVQRQPTNLRRSNESRLPAVNTHLKPESSTPNPRNSVPNYQDV